VKKQERRKEAKTRNKTNFAQTKSEEKWRKEGKRTTGQQGREKHITSADVAPVLHASFALCTRISVFVSSSSA
jgi:hypothetical protein